MRRGVWVQLLRKERSVGVVPQASTIYEVLEELAIAVQVPTSVCRSKILIQRKLQLKDFGISPHSVRI